MELTRSIIGAAIEVHRALGPGLLESAYEAYLCRELSLRGLRYARQVGLPVVYKGPVHEAQLLSYLRLGGWKVGLLINFHVEVLRRGIRRMVL